MVGRGGGGLFVFMAFMALKGSIRTHLLLLKF